MQLVVGAIYKFSMALWLPLHMFHNIILRHILCVVGAKVSEVYSEYGEEDKS